MEKSFKRLLSFAMALFMVLSLVPFNGLEVYAADSVSVAKVGNTEYTTIDDAIAHWTNGTTLTLLADVTLSDVITLKSTEHHILNLGTYTMTAASKKDAIQIENCGRSSASYALDIKADATNPGGITATGKAIVRTTGKSGVKDRPIIRFYGGVFTASYIVYHSGSNGTNCPQFQFHGGEFNGTVNTNRALNQFYGGTFNGSLMMSVDSSAYTMVAGGTFKQLSNLYMSSLNSDKFTIGSSKGANNGSVCVDENGYYVITTTTPTNAEASVASNYNSSNYFYYSTVNTNGMYYEDVYDALEANKTGVVTVFADTLDLTDTSFKGTIVAPEGHTLTVTNAPDGLKTEGNVIIIKPVAAIGNQTFDTLQAAIDAAVAQGGEVTVTLTGDVTENVTITEKVGLYLTIDGADETMNGNVTVKALSDSNDNRRTTIQNVNFVNSGDTSVDFITSNETNHYPRLTVADCSFTGNGKDTDVAIRTKSAYGMVIEDCTGTRLHSFLQNTSGVTITVKDVTVTDSKGGLAMGTAQNVTISGCDLTTRTYGIRLDAVLDTAVTLTDNTVNAYIPVSVRKATAENYQLTIDGESSSYTATNADGKWCAICATEYEEGVALNAPSGKVHVTLNGTGLEKAGVYGAYKRPATGTITYGFTSQTGVWGETTNNASESMMVELYYGDVKIATSQLNNIGGIIDGDVYVTWQMPFAGSTDEYWTVEWAEGYPNKDAQPTKVVLVVDGTVVAENEVQMNAPDNLHPVVWEELEFFKVPVAQTLDAEGNVIGSYFTFEEALAAACADANVTRLEILADSEQTTVTNTTAYYNINQALTIGALTGKSYTVTVAPNSTAMNVRVQNGGSLTIEENVTINHLNVVANGFATTGENMTIEGTLYALSLKQWTNSGTITVTKTGKVILGNGDGQFDLAYGNGTVTINGTGDKTVDQFKAGYSGTRGNGNTLDLNNTSFEAGAWFTVNGSNGIFNVNNSVLKVSGGDFNGDLTVTSTGNKINLINGSELKVGALVLGEGNQLKLDTTSKVTAKTVTGAGTLIIDATGMEAGDIFEGIAGNVSGFTGKIEVTGSNLVAEIVDGMIVLKAAPVAKIGNTYYATLQAAVNAAVEGDTITLLTEVADVDATVNKAVTIDLNKKTITDAYIVVTKAVTIKNGSIKNDNEAYPLVVQNGGALTVEDVAIEASKSDRAIWVRSGSSLVFESGSILATKGANNTKTSLITAIYTDTNTDVTINSGTITVDTPDNKAVGIYGNYSNANVTVNGGKISTSGKGYNYGINVDGDITVNGGEIVTNEKGYGYSSGIRYGNNYALVTALGDVTITNGKITTNSYSGYLVHVGRTYSSNDQTITITGGEFTNNLSDVEMTTGGHMAPVIIWEGTASNVTATISGGTFTGFSQDMLRGDNTDLAVSGGTFDMDVTEYCAEGYIPVDNGDGTYTVVHSYDCGTWGGIDWKLYDDGTLVIAPTKGAPVADENSGKTYEVGEWREAVRYDSTGEGEAIEGWPYDRTKVTKLVIEEGVTSIGSFTAQGFTNLTGEVIIPSTVTYIGQEAFQKSTFTKLTFAEGGTEELCIAQGAFKDLIIEEVALPDDRPVHLHAWVFNNCHNLKYVSLPASLVSVHGTNHIDYFKDFEQHSNPTWTKSSEIFAYDENLVTITFGSEEVRDMFFANNNGTSKDYLIAYNGLTAYCDLQDAINAAQNGETIKLIKDVTLTEGVVVAADKIVTLDLNGKTVRQSKACTDSYSMIENKGSLTITGNGKLSFADTGAGDPNAGWGVYTIHNSGTLVVENGTIENLSAQNVTGQPFAHTSFAIFQYSGSTTIRDGKISTPNYRSVRLWKGEMTIDGGEFDGQVWVQAVDNSAKLTINGGSFSPNWNDGSSVFLENKTYTIDAEITGGKFAGKIGTSNAAAMGGIISGGIFTENAKENTDEDLLALARQFAANTDASTMEQYPYGVVVNEKIVAWNMQTGVEYETVELGLVAAKSGETVQMLVDSNEENSVLLILNGVTLDLNGKTLTALYAITTSVEAGIIDSTNAQGILKVAKTNLTIQSNAQLPVWIKEEAGFRFANVTPGQFIVDATETAAAYAFYIDRDYSNDIIAKELADGSEDGDGLSVTVRMYYTDSNGMENVLNFAPPAERLMATAQTWYDTSVSARAISMTVYGIDNITNISFQSVYAYGNTTIVSERIALSAE